MVDCELDLVIEWDVIRQRRTYISKEIIKLCSYLSWIRVCTSVVFHMSKM